MLEFASPSPRSESTEKQFTTPTKESSISAYQNSNTIITGLYTEDKFGLMQLLKRFIIAYETAQRQQEEETNLIVNKDVVVLPVCVLDIDRNHL